MTIWPRELTRREDEITGAPTEPKRSIAGVEATFRIPGFWIGAAEARDQIAKAEAHPRDADEHRRVAEGYRNIAEAATRKADIAAMPEYQAWWLRNSSRPAGRASNG